MALRILALLLLAAAPQPALAVRVVAKASSSAAAAANPIRRVVNMLAKMQTKVKEEADAEGKLYERFMCYCKTGSGDLTKSITAAETKVPQVDSSLKEAGALKTQLDQDLVGHKADRADAKDAVAKATALREKEAAAFAKESSDAKTNVAALGKAIAAIEAGTAGSFLQTTAAGALRRLTISADMSSLDRDLMSSFLTQGQGNLYAPKSGQITGILKEMKDTMEKGLSETVATEEQAVADYEALVAAKGKEIKANSAAIESKLERTGQVGVEIVSMKEDLDDTQKALLQDKKFLADLDKNCATKTAEWTARSETRSEELLALAETIKILNEDDALELFKKTLPTASLLQVSVGAKELRGQALKVLRGAASAARRGGRGDPRLELVALALRGRATGFEKVTKMIDEMVALLVKEQASDDSKKAYCEKELDTAEDAKKGLDMAVSDLSKAIEGAEGSIAVLTEEIAALGEGIKVLDKQVAEATETRKEEHELFVETLASDGAAKELIEAAKNRLAKFYNPKLYKAPAKVELSREERIVENMGGAALVQDAPAPPPETWGAYQKKGEESTGVVTMLDMLKADLDKEMQEITVDEKDSQAEYEQYMEDSAAKRAADSKSVSEKETAKADLESELQKMTGESKAKTMEAMAKAEFIQNLHKECDWLVSNFEVRKTARSGEMDSLKKAKAVLSGSDYSLVQMATAHLRGGCADCRKL